MVVATDPAPVPGSAGETELLEVLVELLGRQLDWHGTLTTRTRLVEDLELDSLRQLTFVVELEDRFGICLDEGDEQGLRTVQDVLDMLRRRLDEQHPAAARG